VRASSPSLSAMSVRRQERQWLVQRSLTCLSACLCLQSTCGRQDSADRAFAESLTGLLSTMRANHISNHPLPPADSLGLKWVQSVSPLSGSAAICLAASIQSPQKPTNLSDWLHPSIHPPQTPTDLAIKEPTRMDAPVCKEPKSHPDSVTSTDILDPNPTPHSVFGRTWLLVRPPRCMQHPFYELM
jgi:hypothetical protein